MPAAVVQPPIAASRTRPGIAAAVPLAPETVNRPSPARAAARAARRRSPCRVGPPTMAAAFELVVAETWSWPWPPGLYSGSRLAWPQSHGHATQKPASHRSRKAPPGGADGPLAEVPVARLAVAERRRRPKRGVAGVEPGHDPDASVGVVAVPTDFPDFFEPAAPTGGRLSAAHRHAPCQRAALRAPRRGRKQRGGADLVDMRARRACPDVIIDASGGVLDPLAAGDVGTIGRLTKPHHVDATGRTAPWTAPEMAPEEIPGEPQADDSTAATQGVGHDAVGHLAPSLLWPTGRRLRDGIPDGNGRQQADDSGHQKADGDARSSRATDVGKHRAPLVASSCRACFTHGRTATQRNQARFGPRADPTTRF